MAGQLAEYTRRLLGRASSLALGAVRLVAARRAAGNRGIVNATDELDRTGILVESAVRLPLKWQDEQVIFPWYRESLAHSFWRAQEFSLFRRNRGLLQAPVLDFGCGDGSFAAVLFDQVDIGADIDAQALALAQQFGIYSRLVQSVGSTMPLPDGTVGSVFSNSVLEHCMALDAVLADISRVLRPGGVFCFTVPVAQFGRDLTRYFGRSESELVNTSYFHRNLLEVSDWRERLARQGLSTVTVQEYQPSWFTFYYMMFRLLGNHGFGRAFPNIRETVWSRYEPGLVDMVRRSIGGGIGPGGNIFVVARKGV